MLSRDTIRPDRIYWVKRRSCDEVPTLATTSGELPSLSLRPMDSHSYPSCDQYDFLGEAKMNELFTASFHGLTLEDLLPNGAKIVD